MSTNNNSGNLLAGILLGAAAGVAAGLLLAPEKGSVTRDKLKKKADDLSENFDKYAEDATKKAKAFATDVEKQIKDTLSNDAADLDSGEKEV